MTLQKTQSKLVFDEVEDASQEAERISVPHPIPYQGSKRKLAPLIAAFIVADNIQRFVEPFAGSAAMTLFASTKNLANRYHINDTLTPLICLWNEIISNPGNIADRYENIWRANEGNELLHYNQIREAFNTDGEPAKLLYLLARCVKNAVRFNSAGEFNQSADKRRLGTRPDKMRKEILNASTILRGRTTASSNDFQEILASASKDDFVYMDPPWEGTSGGKDTRYHKLLNKNLLIEQLESLVRRDVPFLLSFDGRLGNKSYGNGLPTELGLTRIEINAGRSSQATLSGRDDSTFESLYLSPSLVLRIENTGHSNLITQFLPKAANDN